MSSLDLCQRCLKDLVAFPSLTGHSNLDIAAYVADYLGENGIEAQLDRHRDGRRANLFATIGPERDGGIILSGHFDVVPADPTGWTNDPFELTLREGRLYGRGAVDMKGFLALCLAAVPEFTRQAADFAVPLHLAFTFDEEVGSIGARQFVDFFRRLDVRPAVAIIGEPTDMQPVIGHKAGLEMVGRVTGLAGHASIPDRGVSAIQYASRFIDFLYGRSRELAASPRPGSSFEPPYTTISVGAIHGGEARNVIADQCEFLWEIRPIPEDDGKALLREFSNYLDREILPEMKKVCGTASFELIEEASYPGLRPDGNEAALSLVRQVWPQAGEGQVVSFGTDAGCFQQAGMSCVVFGPGSLAQAHQTDEFISLAALEQGASFLKRLAAWLKTGAVVPKAG